MNNKKNSKKRKLTRDYLLRSTYRYLERFATTEANLKFVLSRKVDRIIMEDADREAIRQEADIWITEIVSKCVANNLINDRQFALSRANSLFLSGNALSIVKNKLRSKGVPIDIIDDVISEIYKEKPDINFLSGIKYAKRRRFGAFRIKDESENTMKRETAAMARAGFSYVETMKILKATRRDLEDILYND